MRLDFLIMADKAEAINGKLYMIGGGFDRIGVPQFPGSATYDLALSFLVDYNETNESHEFSLALKDADDNDLRPPLAGQIEVGRPAGMKAGQEQRVIIVFRGPFPVSGTGTFRWVPTLDGNEDQSTRFHVDRVDLPGAPRPRQR